MLVKNIDTESTSSAFYAVLAYKDALRINSNFKSTYNDQQIKSAVSAEALLSLGYKFDSSYINYRAKFIAVKLSNARVYDRALVKEAEDILESKGFVKLSSKQGLIYRLPRSV